MSDVAGEAHDDARDFIAECVLQQKLRRGKILEGRAAGAGSTAASALSRSPAASGSALRRGMCRFRCPPGPVPAQYHFRRVPVLLVWLKRVFSRRDSAGKPAQRTEPRKSWGQPISCDPVRKDVPNDSPASQKRDPTERQGSIIRTCRKCGNTYTLPENVQHWPDYCQACRARAPAQAVTRKCRGCGNEFTFPSSERRWPNYCRDCQANRRGKK